MNTKFNALATRLIASPINTGDYEQMRALCSEARYSGVSGLLISIDETIESMTLSKTRKLNISAVYGSAINPSLAVINGHTSLIIGINESEDTFICFLLYIEMLTAGIPVPPFLILETVNDATVGFHIEETAFDFTNRWWYEPHPLLNDSRPTDLWNIKGNDVIYYLARIAKFEREHGEGLSKAAIAVKIAKYLEMDPVYDDY